MLGTDELYKLLYRHMGPQNWWPADNDIEMMLGAILVQNTRWRNAEIALNQIKEHTHFNPSSIRGPGLDTSSPFTTSIRVFLTALILLNPPLFLMISI